MSESEFTVLGNNSVFAFATKNRIYSQEKVEVDTYYVILEPLVGQQT